MKKIKFLAVCVLMLLLLTACGDKSSLKSSLDSAKLTTELPPVSDRTYNKLADVDEEVFEQQLAACEMYIEAYEITKPSVYTKKYKDEVDEDRIEYYCNNRRKELQTEIGTKLSDNVYELIKNVRDCDNMEAYLDRVNLDATLFYDYYSEYLYSDDEDKALCDILKVFYERSNVLAFTFMDEYKDEIIEAAMKTIEDNADADTDLNMYIAMNNELIRALNNVYGGVNERYAERITESNIKLAKKLLETDDSLSDKEIQNLIAQLGQATPQPSEKATEKPTETPEVSDKPTMIPIPTRIPTATQKPEATKAPVKTEAPEPTPKPTEAPATAAPTQDPDAEQTDDTGETITLTS